MGTTKLLMTWLLSTSLTSSSTALLLLHASFLILGYINLFSCLQAFLSAIPLEQLLSCLFFTEPSLFVQT